MGGEKPFDATPSRIARARREGDLPRSSDLGAVASLSCAALAVFAGAPALARAASIAIERSAFGERALAPYATIATLSLAMLVAGAAGSLGATFAQTRRFAFTGIAFKPERVNPVAGLKRMFGVDALVAAAKATVVASVVGAVLAPRVAATFAPAAIAAPAPDLAARTWGAIGAALASAVGASAFFAIVDVLVERAKWRRRLRMTFAELKRDLRTSDGDPALKGKRRRAQRALSRGSIGSLARAAFVVANPTHVAIALEYAPPEIAVPRVLVRAIDDAAREVRRRARELGVPVVENVALARSLLRSANVGDPIPPDSYVAVAAIVAALAAR